VYDAQWTVNVPHFNSLDKFYVQVSQVHFMNLVYPTNSNNNAFLISVDGAAQQTVTLDPGYYTSTTILSALDTLLTIAPITVTTSYSETTRKLTFTVTGGTLEFFNTSNSMYYALGMEPSNFSGSFTSKTSDYPIDLSGVKNLIVSSNMRPRNNYQATNLKMSHLVVIPLANSFGTVEIADLFSSPYYYVQNAGVHTIEISMHDENGNAFELPDNVNVLYTITFRGAYTDLSVDEVTEHLNDVPHDMMHDLE
jgi:hypothetical protein